MVTPKVGVLALQGDVVEHRRILDSLGVQTLPVRRPLELDRVDALVIPGGESTTMDKLLRAFELHEPLRERIKRGMPVYGSCAGMILLADRIEDGIAGQETVGGIDMAVRRNAFGRQVDSFEADVVVATLDSPFHAVFIRAPWVEQVGPACEVLARIQSGPVGRHPAGGEVLARIQPGPAGRVVAVRQGCLLTTAFHPELTGDPRLHQLFIRLVEKT